MGRRSTDGWHASRGEERECEEIESWVRNLECKWRMSGSRWTTHDTEYYPDERWWIGDGKFYTVGTRTGSYLSSLPPELLGRLWGRILFQQEDK